MIYIALPISDNHGWGVVGRYVARKLAQLTDTQLIVSPEERLLPFDPMEGFELGMLMPEEGLLSRVDQAARQGAIVRLDGPLLKVVNSADMSPSLPHLRGSRTFGYSVFEQQVLPTGAVQRAREQYDMIVTGSAWCAEMLRRNGFPGAIPVLQGIDPGLFFPAPEIAPRDYFRDEFVIFSGGKFEHRKGQDLVIRAVAIMQQRHDDVILVNSWFNIWPWSLQSMAVSPHIKHIPPPGTSQDFARQYLRWMQQLLELNGVDVSRTITLPLRMNSTMPRVYQYSDVGVFPNRCEGGTNLVMMEYMACGKPVIAARYAGQAEALADDTCIPLAAPNGEVVFDELLEKLEWAYQNRDALRAIGQRGGKSMLNFTWGHTAAKLLEIMSRA